MSTLGTLGAGAAVAPITEFSDVAIVHDYITQRGGAERVALAMADAFPGAPIHTSLFEPTASFPEFAQHRVKTTSLNRAGRLRSDHRLAFPLLAPTFSRLRIMADVVLCSSSGWAHGANTDGRKIVYCHTPARWLYQPDRYFGRGEHQRGARLVGAAFASALKAWDRRAARTADRYLVNSRVVRDRVRDLYGIQAEVVPPPHGAEPNGREEAVAGVEAGAVLCVARLLPYKNVGPVIEAFRDLPAERLVIVGDGPLHAALQRACPFNVRLLGQVSDEQLRWLYRRASGLVAASYEDFGLTPLEAAAFGTPSAVLRWGGFLDTTIDGETGVFFDEPWPALIASAVRRLRREHWDATRLQSHAARYSREAFKTSLHRIVRETQSFGGV